MRVGPMRALVWMWLLSSVWLPGMWWLQSLSAPGADGWTQAAVVLGGGLALLGFLALSLGLSLRIEQARLRTRAREVLRGGDVSGAEGGEWAGLLEDLRAEARRHQRELERLQQALTQAQEQAGEAVSRASHAAQAAELATGALQRAGQGLEQAIADLPAAGTEPAAPQMADRQVLDDLGSGLRALQQQVQPVLDWLEAAPQDNGDAEPGAEFFARATSLAESLQLLCLNFRLALERLGGAPSGASEDLDAMVQDLEPLCAQATGLLDALAGPGPTLGVPGALRQAGQHASQRLQALQAALERAAAQTQAHAPAPSAVPTVDGARGALQAALRQIRAADAP